MLFRRRKPPSLYERLRVGVWPRRSWARSLRYFLLRLRRLSESPYSIAMGFACGVFAIATPFLGLQMVLAAIAAWALRGSVLASAIGSFAGNPITYPIIWISTYQIGNAILGASGETAPIDFQARAEAMFSGVRQMSPLHISSGFEGFWPLLKPMALGSIPVGLLIGAVSYIAMWRLITTARRERRTRLKLKAA